MKTWSQIEIVLPLPPSNNDLVRPALAWGRGRQKLRLVSTAVAEAFRIKAVEEIWKLAARHGQPALLTGPVSINAIWFVPTLASDCNNRWKALEDAITASKKIWRDDKQVSLGLAEKRFAAAGAAPTCVVRVEARESEDHARRLAEAEKRKPRSRRALLNATPNWIPAT